MQYRRNRTTSGAISSDRNLHEVSSFPTVALKLPATEFSSPRENHDRIGAAVPRVLADPFHALPIDPTWADRIGMRVPFAYIVLAARGFVVSAIHFCLSVSTVPSESRACPSRVRSRSCRPCDLSSLVRLVTDQCTSGFSRQSGGAFPANLCRNAAPNENRARCLSSCQPSPHDTASAFDVALPETAHTTHPAIGAKTDQ
jgi:hypothetical protein